MATVANLRNALQAVPDRASETIEKLSNTSANARVTRERLTSELVSDLRLFADLEEQHLFPAARKAVEAKALLPKAVNDNKQLRARLDELEGEPKDTDEFLEHVSTLKREFDQRLREERRELLPAVAKALDRNEVQEIIDRIEAAIRNADKARREHAAERRRVAEADEGEADAASPAGTMAADPTREVAETFAEQARQAASSMSEALVIQRRTVEATMGDLTAANAALARSAGSTVEIASAWADLVGSGLQTSVRAAQRLSQCRTLRDVVDVQREFATEAMQGWIDRSARLLEAMQRAAGQAIRPLRERGRERA